MAQKKHIDIQSDISHIIGNTLRSSILVLAGEIMRFKDYREWPEPFDTPECIIDAKERLSKLFCQFDDVDFDADSALDEITAVKETVYSLGDTVRSIRYQIALFYDCDEARLFEGEESGEMEYVKNIPEFFRYLIENIEGSAEAVSRCMSEIMSYMPVRMTRDRFSRYVEDSFKEFAPGSPKRYAEAMVSDCMLCVSIKPHPLITGYEDVMDRLMAFWESFYTDSNKMSSEAENELFDEVECLYDDLYFVESQLECILNICNSFIILLANGFGPSGLDDSQLREKDAYMTAKAIISGEYEAEAFEDTFTGMADEIINSLGEENQKLLSKTFKVLDKQRGSGGKTDDLNSERLVTYANILLLLEEDLSGARIMSFGDNTAKVSDQELREYAATLNKCIREGLKAFPNGIQKAKRAHLMSILECPFEPDEFLDYISDNLSDSSAATRLFFDGRLRDLYMEYDFIAEGNLVTPKKFFDEDSEFIDETESGLDY